MIRINLLPVRKVQKAVRTRQQIETLLHLFGLDCIAPLGCEANGAVVEHHLKLLGRRGQHRVA